ncbi:MAG TPA: hypothetical protein VKP11_01010 [Frankiaceae bacterium]|nr:hypothetical protein [Frankiaceae bacterium]
MGRWVTVPPTPPVAPPSTRPTRRALLLAALAGPVAACTAGRHPADPRRGVAAEVERRDAALRSEAVADESALAAACTATAERHPTLAGLLGVVSAHHEEHLRRLTPAGSLPASRPGSPAADGPVTPIPGDPGAALAALARRERAAQAARLTGCLGASRALAPLLGSIGAAAAAHAELLGRPS